MEVMGLTVLVIAGASQLTAIQLMVDGAPVFMVLAASLAVNMRMAMYSAALTPYLGSAPVWQRALVAYTMVDQAYAVSAVTFEAEPERSVAWRMAFYFGVLLPIVPLWYLGSYLGAVLGDAIPPEIGLDAAVPVAFIAVFAPALRTRAHIAAAAVAIVTALALAFLPWNMGLIVAALAGMTAGAEIERRRPEIVQ
jgi:predicted branched-subunit amino acid permease